MEGRTDMINIGKKWNGSSFFMLKTRYPNVCLVHLYVLEGTIQHMEYNRLSDNTKEELKEFSRFLNA